MRALFAALLLSISLPLSASAGEEQDAEAIYAQRDAGTTG